MGTFLTQDLKKIQTTNQCFDIRDTLQNIQNGGRSKDLLLKHFLAVSEGGSRGIPKDQPTKLPRTDWTNPSKTLPSGKLYKKLLKMAIEIVSFPIENCDFP